MTPLFVCSFRQGWISKSIIIRKKPSFVMNSIRSNARGTPVKSPSRSNRNRSHMEVCANVFVCESTHVLEMPHCFTLSFSKKLSIFSSHHDWDHSSNYIAKRYIEDVPMARYFDDVMMQMTTKLWATHYSHHNPPKKVGPRSFQLERGTSRIGRHRSNERLGVQRSDGSAVLPSRTVYRKADTSLLLTDRSSRRTRVLGRKLYQI